MADYSAAEGDALRFAAGTQVTSTVTDNGLILTAGDTTVTLIGISTAAAVDIILG